MPLPIPLPAKQARLQSIIMRSRKETNPACACCLQRGTCRFFEASEGRGDVASLCGTESYSEASRERSSVSTSTLGSAANTSRASSARRQDFDISPRARLVCADGGNPDPTLTHGKDAKKAKEIELEGWNYPKHLAGRLFAVVVHGDVEGAENVRRAISDWLRFMELCPAGSLAELDRYIGYWRPYATSHDELDQDQALQEEVRNAARTLVQGVIAKRAGKFMDAGQGLKPPRQK